MLKYIHTIIFFFQAACLFYILYAGIVRAYNLLLLLAIGSILINGVMLMLNEWKCPLTTFAERHGAMKGSVTDIFLPDWIAPGVFRVAAVLFPAELVLLTFRYFTGL
ncbi:MAG: hypothetical protein Q8Q07_03035 [Dehalococcoidales bacterium]|nr:hypothetical protein [Dehalococcoidales bacterium]